jgi:sodium/proline symporter
MSTADSQLLVTSSTLTEDLYKAFFRRSARDMELVWVGRVAVVVVAAAAAWLAFDPESSVLGLVAYAWGGFGAAFGPLILISLYWKRMTRNGAIAGIIVGGLTVIIWRQISGGLFELYELLPGFVFSTLAIVVVSLLDTPPTREIEDEFGRATASAEAAVHTPFVHEADQR